jgi:hypothetical protein
MGNRSSVARFGASGATLAFAVAGLLAAAVAQAQPPAPSVSSPPAASNERPPSSGALPPAPANPTPQDLTKAKAVFDAGGRAFDQGDFAGAIQAFEQAYALSGRPSVLFSLAQAHRKRFVDLGVPADREAALELYRAYLAAVKTGGRRADAVKGLESLGVAGNGGSGGAVAAQPMVRKTQLAIDSSTPGAMISVDGGAAAPPQVMAEVTPGRHTVRVTAPGHVEKEFVTQAVEGQITPETYELEEQPAKLEIEMPGDATIYVNGRDMGKSTQLTVPPGPHFVSVVRTGHHPEARPIQLAAGESQKLAFELKTTTQRDVSYGFMIGGAVVVAGGGALLAAAFVRQDAAQQIELRRESGSISAAELDAYDAARKDRDILRASGLLVGGVGGLGVLIGAALFVLDNEPPAQPPADGAVDKKKREKPKDAPLEMEQMRLVPWVAPERGGGISIGGVWSAAF